jgi:hypothetical protein
MLTEIGVPLPTDALEEPYVEADDEFNLALPRSYWVLEGSLYRKTVRTAAFHVLAEVATPEQLVTGKAQVVRAFIWRRLGQELTDWAVTWIGTLTTDRGPLVLLEKASRP